MNVPAGEEGGGVDAGSYASGRASVLSGEVEGGHHAAYGLRSVQAGSPFQPQEGDPAYGLNPRLAGAQPSQGRERRRRVADGPTSRLSHEAPRGGQFPRDLVDADGDVHVPRVLSDQSVGGGGHRGRGLPHRGGLQVHTTVKAASGHSGAGYDAGDTPHSGGLGSSMDAELHHPFGAEGVVSPGEAGGGPAGSPASARPTLRTDDGTVRTSLSQTRGGARGPQVHGFGASSAHRDGLDSMDSTAAASDEVGGVLGGAVHDSPFVAAVHSGRPSAPRRGPAAPVGFTPGMDIYNSTGTAGLSAGPGGFKIGDSGVMHNSFYAADGGPMAGSGTRERLPALATPGGGGAGGGDMFMPRGAHLDGLKTDETFRTHGEFSASSDMEPSGVGFAAAASGQQAASRRGRTDAAARGGYVGQSMESIATISTVEGGSDATHSTGVQQPQAGGVHQGVVAHRPARGIRHYNSSAVMSHSDSLGPTTVSGVATQGGRTGGGASSGGAPQGPNHDSISVELQSTGDGRPQQGGGVKGGRGMRRYQTEPFQDPAAVHGGASQYTSMQQGAGGYNGSVHGIGDPHGASVAGMQQPPYNPSQMVGHAAAHAAAHHGQQLHAQSFYGSQIAPSQAMGEQGGRQLRRAGASADQHSSASSHGGQGAAGMVSPSAYLSAGGAPFHPASQAPPQHPMGTGGGRQLRPSGAGAYGSHGGETYTSTEVPQWGAGYSSQMLVPSFGYSDLSVDSLSTPRGVWPSSGNVSMPFQGGQNALPMRRSNSGNMGLLAGVAASARPLKGGAGGQHVAPVASTPWAGSSKASSTPSGGAGGAPSISLGSNNSGGDGGIQAMNSLGGLSKVFSERSDSQ